MSIARYADGTVFALERSENWDAAAAVALGDEHFVVADDKEEKGFRSRILELE